MSSGTRRRIAFFFSLQLCALSFVEPTYAAVGQRVLVIAESTFRIPNSNLAPIGNGVGSTASSDPVSVDGLLLLFNPDELRAASPAIELDYEIAATLQSAASLPARLAGESELSANIWNGRGRFSGSSVEQSSVHGLLRVRAAGIKNFWDLVRLAPKSGEPMPEDANQFWVASCRTAHGRPPQEGRCETYVAVDDVMLQFSLRERDFNHLGEIRAALAAQIRRWKDGAREE